jgi:hypothetical protein
MIHTTNNRMTYPIRAKVLGVENGADVARQFLALCATANYRLGVGPTAQHDFNGLCVALLFVALKGHVDVAFTHGVERHVKGIRRHLLVFKVCVETLDGEKMTIR